MGSAASGPSRSVTGSILSAGENEYFPQIAASKGTSFNADPLLAKVSRPGMAFVVLNVVGCMSPRWVRGCEISFGKLGFLAVSRPPGALGASSSSDCCGCTLNRFGALWLYSTAGRFG